MRITPGHRLTEIWQVCDTNADVPPASRDGHLRTARGMRVWRPGSFCSRDGLAARGIKGSGQIGIWMAGQETAGSIVIDERIAG
jgi:hypothetical protein